MTLPPFDLPAPLAAVAFAAVVVAVTYLATVDWTHPHTPKGPR